MFSGVLQQASVQTHDHAYLNTVVLEKFLKFCNPKFALSKCYGYQMDLLLTAAPNNFAQNKYVKWQKRNVRF
jgi:hypothetical protein